MAVDTQKLREKSQDAIAEALGDAYDCMRVWSAWGVGTMGPDDFALVTDDSDRLAEITDAALTPVLPVIDAQAAEITRLRDALKHLYHNAYASGADMGLALDVAEAALSGEPNG